MTEAELEALCERANINTFEANDALRTVQLLCAAPPHGLLLPRSAVRRVLYAAASLYVTVQQPGDQGARGFYRFVEDLTVAMKRARRAAERTKPASPTPPSEDRAVHF